MRGGGHACIFDCTAHLTARNALPPITQENCRAAKWPPVNFLAFRFPVKGIAVGEGSARFNRICRLRCGACGFPAPTKESHMLYFLTKSDGQGSRMWIGDEYAQALLDLASGRVHGTIFARMS
jgi:hypothetical protein